MNNKLIGGCSKHPGMSFFDCPLCQKDNVPNLSIINPNETQKQKIKEFMESINKTEQKSITITPEEGYELDKENSTFDLDKCIIKFKQKEDPLDKLPKKFEDLKIIFGKDVEILINY